MKDLFKTPTQVEVSYLGNPDDLYFGVDWELRMRDDPDMREHLPPEGPTRWDFVANTDDTKEYGNSVNSLSAEALHITGVEKPSED